MTSAGLQEARTNLLSAPSATLLACYGDSWSPSGRPSDRFDFKILRKCDQLLPKWRHKGSTCTHTTHKSSRMATRTNYQMVCRTVPFSSATELCSFQYSHWVTHSRLGLQKSICSLKAGGLPKQPATTRHFAFT